MTEEEFRAFIESVEWVFAKSYSETYPHSYTTRDRVGNDAYFEKFIYYARENAVLKSFYSKQYLYFELDGFEYWEMGRPLKAIQVLNKAPINDDKKYRFPAPAKEDRDILLHKLKTRDLYVKHLLSIKRNIEQEQELVWLMQNQRKSANIIDYSKKQIKDYGTTIRQNHLER